MLAHNELQESTLRRYHYTFQRIKQLIPPYRQDSDSESTKKRGIISWLGNLAGLANDADLKRLTNTVNKITQVRDDEITAFEKTLNDYSSMSKITNGRINNIRDTLEIHSQGMSELVKNMHEEVSDLNNIAKLMAVVVSRLSKIAEIHNHIVSLMEAVQQLSHGNLDPFLISPYVLNDTFQKVRPALFDIHPNLEIASNLFEIYRMNEFIINRVDLNLIISVRFPITVLRSPIQVFRAISIKTPLSYESSDCTELSGLPWAIGIGRDDRIYLIFNEKPPLGKSVIDVNKVDVTIMSTDHTSCIWALFSNGIWRYFSTISILMLSHD
jgi:hypothetical protein